MCNFKYIFINEIGFIKKKLKTVGKLTKNRLLWDGAVLREAPKDGDKVRKFSHHARQGWDKTKPCGVGAKIPSFGPALPHCHP